VRRINLSGPRCGSEARTVIAFMSANHIDPDLAAEVFVLKPGGAPPA
jgi:hypothetical protein